MPTDTYNSSSKGPLRIADMNFHHVKHALGVLEDRRALGAHDRDDEFEALTLRKAALDAEFAAAEALKAETPAVPA